MKIDQNYDPNNTTQHHHNLTQIEPSLLQLFEEPIIQKQQRISRSLTHMFTFDLLLLCHVVVAPHLEWIIGGMHKRDSQYHQQ